MAALAEGFRPVEAIDLALPDRLLSFVVDGTDEAALVLLGSAPNAALLLGIDLSYGGLPPSSRQTPVPAWDVLLDSASELPAPVLLRFAKVFSATLGPGKILVHIAGKGAVVHQMIASLQPLSPPPWLELLIRLGARTEYKGAIFPIHKNRLPAETVERLLEADGHDPEMLYKHAFPARSYDSVSMNAMSLLGGLGGYGERLARRHGLVRNALCDSSALVRSLAIETFQKLAIPVAPFLHELAGLAAGSAKGVREGASLLVGQAGAAAFPALRAIAETGKPEERAHALRLIGRLELAEGQAFLRERAGSEKTPSVRKVLDELMLQAGQQSAGAPRTETRGDVLAHVALDEGFRSALAAWGGHLTGDEIQQAFALLTDPQPWSVDPPRVLEKAAKQDLEGLRLLLARPELTPLHAVRLLRLAGLLQPSPHAALAGHLDYSVPRQTFERLMAAYRDSHQPRLSLRDLADAFQAAALDPETIAGARLMPASYRRFDWDDESTWSYFADRQDWLARHLEAPARAARHWGTGMMPPAQRRQTILAILTAFPEPPARFVPRLWDLALGAVEGERDLACKCLEKLPDWRKRLFDALKGGKAQMRSAAIGWLKRSRPEGAILALCAALEVEKTAEVKAALASALESLGEAQAAASTAQADPRGRAALQAEAVAGLKKGIPAKCSWFPFDRLPAVRWGSDGTPITPDVVQWLAVSAWKTRSAEPTVILREQVKLIHEQDARRLGESVFEAWLAEDLRPPTQEELTRRLLQFMTWTGAASIDEIVQKRPELAQAVEFERNWPMSTRPEDKGFLALAAACGPAGVVDRIRSYINQWYGYRAAQCRALVQVLAWIDHAEAVAFLLDVAKRFRTATIRQEAEDQVRKLAERKHMTVADLADQSLPDAGFDAEGKLMLDFGPRQFFARLDDDAELVLGDVSGTTIEKLPAPGKNDNPELAAAAKTRLSAVKKESRRFASELSSGCTKRCASSAPGRSPTGSGRSWAIRWPAGSALAWSGPGRMKRERYRHSAPWRTVR